jgi:hypothetical protein
MIQIDDAGSGSLVGGTVIGILRVETGDYYYDVIPVKYFTSPFFEDKSFELYCTEIISDAIVDLSISKDEPIDICQGYIFDDAKSFLSQNGYLVNSTKILEPLQTIIEKTFIDYVIGLGIPLDYLDYTKYPFHFHRLLKWVFADIKSREKLCKTAWKSWKKYSTIEKVQYSDYLVNGNYRCLKCGKSLELPSKIKVIKFTSNKDYFVYIHNSCRSSL